MTTFIEIVFDVMLSGLVAILFYGGMLVIVAKFQDFDQIAKNRFDEKIKKVDDQSKDWYRINQEYREDSKKIQNMQAVMVIMFLIILFWFIGKLDGLIN